MPSLLKCIARGNFKGGCPPLTKVSIGQSPMLENAYFGIDSVLFAHLDTTISHQGWPGGKATYENVWTNGNLLIYTKIVLYMYVWIIYL